MWGFLQVTTILLGALILFIIVPLMFIFKMIKPNGSNRLFILIGYPLAWLVGIFIYGGAWNFLGNKVEQAEADAIVQEAQEAKEKAEKEAQEAKEKAEKEAKKAEKEAQKAKEQAEREREERLSKTGMLTSCRTQLQPNLHNPKSFETDYGATRQVNIDGKLGLELYYYATNGFGATIRSRAICEFDEDGYLVKISQ